MKRKLFLTTLSLGVTSALFIAATTQAADDTKSSTSTSTATSSSDQGATGKGSASISGQSQKFMRLSQLTGSSLKRFWCAQSMADPAAAIVLTETQRLPRPTARH